MSWGTWWRCVGFIIGWWMGCWECSRQRPASGARWRRWWKREFKVEYGKGWKLGGRRNGKNEREHNEETRERIRGEKTPVPEPKGRSTNEVERHPGIKTG